MKILSPLQFIPKGNIKTKLPSINLIKITTKTIQEFDNKATFTRKKNEQEKENPSNSKQIKQETTKAKQ